MLSIAKMIALPLTLIYDNKAFIEYFYLSYKIKAPLEALLY